MDMINVFWRNEIKIDMFGHNQPFKPRHPVPAVKSSIMLWVSFTTSGTSAGCDNKE